MIRLPLRLAGLALALLAAGCTTVHWPTPKHTSDVVLQDDRRDAIATVDLGDALHIILPPPLKSGSQWQIIQLNVVALRQMTDLAPVPNARLGTSEVKFQAIHITSRTQLRFAAVPENSAAADASETFTVNVGVKHQGE